MDELGDLLAGMIQRYVASILPQATQATRDAVAHAVGLTVVRLMSDPAFTEQLTVVARLREENQWLRNNLTIAQEALRTRPSSPRKAAPKKAPAAKKRVPTKSQQAAFKRGVQDVQRGRPTSRP